MTVRKYYNFSDHQLHLKRSASRCTSQCGNNSLCSGQLSPSAVYNCSCRAGFSLNPTISKYCMPVNNCATENGGCAQACVFDGPSLSHCACDIGYSMVNSTCTPINNCQSSNGGCDQNCVFDGPGASHCSCNAGYRLMAKSCAAINNCLYYNGGCGLYSSCIYTGPNTNNCSCNTGYYSTNGLANDCVQGMVD